MSQEIVTHGQMALEAQVVEPDGNILAVVARAASDPKVDVDKMKALLDMQERIMDKNAEIAFNQAMTRLQPRLPQITKDGVIVGKDRVTVRSRYAKFEKVDRIIRPLYTSEGFALTYNTELRDKILFVTVTVRHAMGHKEATTVPVPIDHNEYRTSAQDMGSTISYGKRYATCAALHIVTVDEDNDGDGNGGLITEDQVLTIETLLRDTKADRASFLKFAGASSVDAIPASQYARCINGLKQKAAKR